MLLTGDLEVHKATGIVRPCKAVYKDKDGSLAIFDDIGETDGVKTFDTRLGTFVDTDGKTTQAPSIIVGPDKWERVEREDSHWNRTSTKAVKQKAEERDDVSADDIPDNL